MTEYFNESEHLRIDSQIKAFLDKGGKINVIPPYYSNRTEYIKTEDSFDMARCQMAGTKKSAVSGDRHLLSDRIKDTIKAIKENPGLCSKELGEIIGVSRQSVSVYANRAIEKGYNITKTRKRSTVYYKLED